MYKNTVVVNMDWRLSDLRKWIPQAQTFFQDNAEWLRDLAFDESKIKTSLSFDGKILSADSHLDINGQIHVSNCPIDAIIKGNLLVNIDISSLNTSLDLSQLSSDVSVAHCPLLQDYFTEDDLPQLSFIFPEKIAINEKQIVLPRLQIIDRRNTNRSIVLNDLLYKKTNELEVNYNISLKQPIKTKKIEAEMFDFQGHGKIFADVSTLITQDAEQAISFKIIDDHNQLNVSELKIDSLFVGNLNSEFSFHHSGPNLIELKGKVNSSDIQNGVVTLARASSNISLSGESFNDLQLSIDNRLSQLVHPDVSVQNITNHLDFDISEFESLSFSGNSTITNVSAQGINLLPINVTHSGQAMLEKTTLSSQHEIALEHGFLLQLEQQQTKTKVHINQQGITHLQSLISQFENTLIVKEGSLSASIEFTLPKEGEELIAIGTADFQDISAKYQDYVLNKVAYQTPLTFDSAGLQLAESTLHIDSIDAGVIIEQIEANVIAQDNVFRFKQVQGEILNGQFSFGNLWLDGREQKLNINFKNIDLAQLVALQQQPGIQITGEIDGDMPLIINTQGIRIEDGWMSSITGGTLTITDNPSFDSIKVQQPQLALLENLDFTQLESNVKFTPDGWLFFDFALQGNNPDEKQSVNFNYSHQENIFSLLESIRLVKSVENKVEQKITQGDKK
jgi:hypothetical protein